LTSCSTHFSVLVVTRSSIPVVLCACSQYQTRAYASDDRAARCHLPTDQRESTACHTEDETTALAPRISPGVNMTDQIPHNAQKHVVLGAGPAGRATAAYLSLQNHAVILASRSGSGPTLNGV